MTGELKARIRAELASLYTWPSSLALTARPLYDLSAVMDLGRLADVAEAVQKAKEVSFAIVSKEYVQTGLNWIYAMQNVGLTNFLIVAGDQFTSEMLDQRGIPNVLAVIDEDGFDPSYRSPTGFSAKGLAVSAFKFPVAHFLVKAGYSVVLSDADAVWLHDPAPYLRDADVSFQRIIYHPPAIATQWGFAACGGFNSFRSGRGTEAFLERCLAENQLLYDDQVVLNLALLEGDPSWRCEDADWVLPVQQDRSALESMFVRFSKRPIRGALRREGLKLLALPHDLFWRHGLIAPSLQEMVVCHPNSPKDDLQKMRLLDSMGLRFHPESPISGRPENGR